MKVAQKRWASERTNEPPIVGAKQLIFASAAYTATSPKTEKSKKKRYTVNFFRFFFCRCIYSREASKQSERKKKLKLLFRRLNNFVHSLVALSQVFCVPSAFFLLSFNLFFFLIFQFISVFCGVGLFCALHFSCVRSVVVYNWSEKKKKLKSIFNLIFFFIVKITLFFSISRVWYWRHKKISSSRRLNRLSVVQRVCAKLRRKKFYFAIFAWELHKIVAVIVVQFLLLHEIFFIL